MRMYRAAWLSILFIIIPLLKYVYGLPPKEKLLVNLDISSARPKKIEIIPSDTCPGGLNYAIRGNSSHTHVIGNVTDEGEMIMEGDPACMTRYVFVMTKINGIRYVRVITRYRTNGIYSTLVDEFRKTPSEGRYNIVAKEPIELNLLTQDDNMTISAKVLSQSELESMDLDDISTIDITNLPLKFGIRPEMMDEFMIGAVLYGKHVIDTGRNGMIGRKVIWRGGTENPYVTIITRYADGNEMENKYKFVSEEEGFVIKRIKRKLLNLCE